MSWEDIAKFILLPAIVILLTSGIYTTYTNNLLKENGEYTNAVIYKFNERVNPKFLFYKYIVDSTEYEGWGRSFPRRDTFVGDTIIIIYNKKKPTRSKTKRDLELKVWE
jgi:hypothetical protein